MDNPRFRNNGNNNKGGGGGRGSYRRYSRSRSRSRDRMQNYRNNSRSRSRDRGGYRNDNNNDKDLYRDIINQDYQDDNRNYGGNNNNNMRGNNKFRLHANEEDFGDERYYNERPRNRDRDRDREFDNRDRRDRDRGDNNRDNRRYGGPAGNGGGNNNNNNGNNYNNRHYNNADNDQNDRDSDESDETSSQYYSSTKQNQTPSSTIIVFGLQSHITEADIMSLLIQAEIAPAAIRLIRKRTTGASRGFAFVEFNTTEEAAQWMEYTQGTLQLSDTCRPTLQYSPIMDWDCGKCGLFNFRRRGNCFKCHASRDEGDQTGSMEDDDSKGKSKGSWGNDWYCGMCGVFNFKRRKSCFKCFASRGDSSYGGEGSDEISNILTKKIMLRNLDVLTNEEGVLTAITQHAPELANKITKVFVSRDALTQTSRGICYLNFESLVDSMNMHNLLSTLEPPLVIDEKEVLVSYCVDHENRQIVPKKKGGDSSSGTSTKSNTAPIGPMTAAEVVAAATAASASSGVSSQYTLDDVPRLAEYSASLYATTPAEHAHYLQYYTEYYISEISSGSYGNLPSDTQVTEANSGAAVALSAIKRKQAKMNSIETTATAAATAAAAAAAAVKATLASRAVVTPKGNDGKVYPTPDVSLYQYDETSGYYYDPSTGLYYDAHSQYYYNNETGAYLYWDQRKSTYILATPATVAATVQAAVKQDTDASASTQADDETAKKDKKESGGHKHDKVKVAKKIVKDMEKWAKQLNQKKDYVPVATPQPISTPGRTEDGMRPSTSGGGAGGISSGYADVGFSILEKKATNKLTTNFMSPMSLAAANKLIPAYGSDSEEDVPAPPKINSAAAESNENDYVDFQKLTCLLCKRAFQSLDILQKHLKMSNLHKENLAKHNLSKGSSNVSGPTSESDQETALAAALSYRDRAKERRQKYGEYDPPPTNPSRERFEKEIKNLNSRTADAPVMPIGSNNVGNRLLQKMGWSEGQGLGRKNQGRTNIIEANAVRGSNAGLGTKGGGPSYDYKTYIKKMMKSRYESV